jgi:hypothetical protein
MTEEQIKLLKYIMTKKETEGCNSAEAFNNKYLGGIVCREHCLVSDICNRNRYGEWESRQAEAQRLLNSISIEAIVGEY